MGLERLKILAILNSPDKNFVNRDLYRLLYNRELYVIAYENLKSNKGALTPAADPDATLQGFSLERIDKLIEQMRNQSWKPKLARQILIPKAGKKTLRPLGIQGPEDKIVQEVVRMILEAIYNKLFDKNSYGFRPNLGCHDALKFIDENFDGLIIAMEGDIQAFFPSVCHQILMKILRRKIQDQRFLDVIFKMLRAGYWNQNDGKIEKPDVGTPQGSIVSPILSNIYLNELDKWIRTWEDKNIQKEHHLIKPPERKALISLIREKEKEYKITPSRDLGNEIRNLKLQSLNTNAYEDEWKRERLVYVRYADDFLIGLFTTVERAQRLKQELTDFLREELGLTLSQEKTKITDLRKDAALFLGHEIRIHTSEKITITRPLGKSPFRRRTTGKFVELSIPVNRVLEKLHQKGMCTKTGYPTSCGRLTVYDDEEIVRHFNSVLNGLLNFYSGTKKTNAKYRIYYIIKFSCAKTLAHKHKSSMASIFEKHGAKLTIKRNLQNSKKTTQVSLNPSNTLKKPKFQTGQKLKDPYTIYLKKYTRSNIFACCLICGSPERIEMHHINSLKNIRPQSFAQLHGFVRRKQIPLCFKHHRDVTYGRYDGIPLRELLARTQLTYDPNKIDS